MNLFTRLKALLGGTPAAVADVAATMPAIDESIISRQALLQILAATLKQQEIGHSVLDDGALLLASGLALYPHFIEQHQGDEQRTRTTSSITVLHADLFPQGLTEYQHAIGSDLAASLADGFATWAKMDLLTLQEALLAQPKHCKTMEMSFPAFADKPPLQRQVILGPVAHLVSQAAEVAEEHPFCPCCLLSNSFLAFDEQLKSEDVIGIRLFVSRDKQGNLAADCRVNGIDFAPGVEHLLNYAKSWPERGLELRKQYVVIRNQPQQSN